jgi:hypothetical protein
MKTTFKGLRRANKSACIRTRDIAQASESLSMTIAQTDQQLEYPEFIRS